MNKNLKKFKIVLRNGYSFDMECEHIKVSYSTLTGGASKMEYEGCIHGMPVYLDVSELAAVIQEGVDGDA